MKVNKELLFTIGGLVLLGGGKLLTGIAEKKESDKKLETLVNKVVDEKLNK